MPDLTLSNTQATLLPPTVKRPAGSRWSWAFLIDIAVFLFIFAAIFGVYAIGRSWLGPVRPHAEISQNPRVLPLYALYSLVRISVAYALSLVFALAYGYVAASSRRAEMIMVPLLDILQSIPVLSFLPGVMLAMVAIFPRSQFGTELGSILLIFTGQVWNIAFSFYSSLKTVPRELHEAAIIYRFSRWQRFAELDLPFSTIGLVWNSMMSVAGGWFFLMACEMFVLGKRDFRLPGLGSFLQTAASADHSSQSHRPRFRRPPLVSSYNSARLQLAHSHIHSRRPPRRGNFFRPETTPTAPLDGLSACRRCSGRFGVCGFPRGARIVRSSRGGLSRTPGKRRAHFSSS